MPRNPEQTYQFKLEQRKKRKAEKEAEIARKQAEIAALEAKEKKVMENKAKDARRKRENRAAQKKRPPTPRPSYALPPRAPDASPRPIQQQQYQPSYASARRAYEPAAGQHPPHQYPPRLQHPPASPARPAFASQAYGSPQQLHRASLSNTPNSKITPRLRLTPEQQSILNDSLIRQGNATMNAVGALKQSTATLKQSNSDVANLTQKQVNDENELRAAILYVEM